MEIYTIGYAKKSASEFFGQLRTAGIQRLLDIRLNNTSQLAGFTKMGDFPFFLKEICAVAYQHLPTLAPTEEILSSYRDKKIQWSELESRYLTLLSERRIEETLDKKLFEVPTVLLCSETHPKFCHRRLAAEYLAARWNDVRIVHL